MNFTKILFTGLIAIFLSACNEKSESPKVDVSSPYVGHWVLQDKSSNARTVSLDITDEGNGNFLYYRSWRDQLYGTDKVTKQKAITANLKDGTLYLMGVEPAILSKDGTLHSDNNNYVKEN